METLSSLPIRKSGTNEIPQLKDQSSMEILKNLTDSLKQGCVCTGRLHEDESNADKSTKAFGALLNHIIQQFDAKQAYYHQFDSLLIFMTFLKTIAKATISTNLSDIDSEKCYCKSLWEWQVILQKVKFKILSSILNVMKNISFSDNHGAMHIKNESEIAFAYVLFMVPCPVVKIEHCRRTCHKMMQTFIEQSYDFKSPVSSNFIIRILFVLFCEINEENEIKRQKQIQKGCEKSCRTANVFLKGGEYTHVQNLRQAVLTDLRQHWRNIWVKRFVTIDSGMTYSDNLYFYEIWKALVAVNSTLPFASIRDFVSPALLIIDHLPDDTPISIKWKQLDVLNEILCYGSTLGIQSDIPVEASEIAQRLLRRAQSESFFEDFHIPTSPPGMAGNAKLEKLPEECPTSMIVLQKLVMLYLKAVAVVVREAQAISSSDESASDSSLSSRGSSSVAEEEREMRLIGGNVLHLLNRLRIWLNNKTSRHHTSSLVATTCELFNDQDDSLVESLLCLLDIHTSLNCNYNSRNSYVQEDLTSISSLTGTMLPSIIIEDDSESCTLPSANMGHLMEIFHPVDGFDCLIQNVSNDHSVILDFLLSNETCFLLYFLRILKYFNKNPSSLCSHPSSHARQEILRKTWNSIKKLTNKSLFPYDISPVLKLLDKIVSPLEITAKNVNRPEIEPS